MTYADLRQAIDATVVLSGVILLLQAVPETVYWLVFGTWYGIDVSKILPSDFLTQISSTPRIGFNRVVQFLADIWVAGLVAIVFSLIMAGVALFSKFDGSEMMRDLLNPVTRKDDLIHLQNRMDLLSEQFDNGFREIRNQILAVEDRMPDSLTPRDD